MKLKLYYCWLLVGLASIAPNLHANEPSGSECTRSAPVNERELVSLALNCAPLIQAQQSRLNAHSQSVRAAGRFAEPRLSFGIAPETYSSDQVDEGYQIELSQALPWPGELALNSSLAKAQVRKGYAELDRERIHIALRVRQAYAQWLHSRSTLALSNEHVVVLEQIVEQLQAGYRSGSTARSALLQAQQQLLSLKQDTADLRKLTQRNEIILASATGVANGVEKASTGLASMNPELRYLNASLARLEQHPAIETLRANQSEVSDRLALQRKDRLPDVALMARYNTLWDNEDKRLMVGVGMNLPLDFGKRRAREDSLTAQANALRWQQRDSLLQLESTLQRSFLSWQEHFERGALYEKELLPMASEQLEVSLADFRTGAIDFQSLLIAQQENLETRKRHHAAQRDLRLSRAEFIAAAGLVFLEDLQGEEVATKELTQ